MTPAELVKRIREVGGESQEALAHRLGVSFATVNAWENGRSTPRLVHVARLERIALELGIRTSPVVLVIDDDPGSCAAIEGLLLASGLDVEVVTTTSSTEGLIVCGLLRPVLVFLDVKMPGLDGFEVAALLDGFDALNDTELVFMTASSDPILVERAEAVGARLLQKPLNWATIGAIVGEKLTPATRSR